MECPVCKTITSDADQNRCAVCGTDLEIYLLIENIEKQAAGRKRTIVALILLLAAVIVALILFYMFFFEHRASQEQAAQTNIEKQYIEIRKLTNEKQLLMTSIADLREQVHTLTGQLEAMEKKEKQEAETARPAFKEIFHVVKRGESLQRVALKYYGNGDEYVRIMKDNNIRNANNIIIGQRLKIVVPATD